MGGWDTGTGRVGLRVFQGQCRRYPEQMGERDMYCWAAGKMKEEQLVLLIWASEKAG